ncbi:MAG: 16S rRNA (cytosine(1402)-N(4))-methyltransferase RsmH [Clostridiales bacterium]|nr:16S rRNA (cytosine(1402)-N(4))-methyltransferase RsmH [Clostridiales bacterium]
MTFKHKPVLLDECIDSLNIKETGIYVDGTLGGAGHSQEILKRLKKGAILVGIDQDQKALSVAKQRLMSLNSEALVKVSNTNFENIQEVLQENEIYAVDGILLDIGVSSYQLDEGSRGFSYQKDAPLDMRMDQNKDMTAEYIVNNYSEQELKRVISEYGEEKWASRIAKFIVSEREEKYIATTLDLVSIIKKAIPKGARIDGPHPAKRTFQALRIEVNDELGVLERVIDKAVSVLKPKGRLAIITFHSLEDRIVKTKFAQMKNPCTCPKEFPVCVCGKRPIANVITRRPIIPTKEEIEKNPRARSAKLRVLEKI